MGEVFYEMSEKVMERLPGLDVLLATMRTIMFLNMVSAIKAIFFLSVFRGSFYRIFLKNIKIPNYK
jgi:hypothetical protein